MQRNINEITVCIFLGKKGTLNTVLLTDFVSTWASLKMVNHFNNYI